MRFKVNDIVRVSKQSSFYNDDLYHVRKDTNGVIYEIISSWDTGETCKLREEDLKLVKRP